MWREKIQKKVSDFQMAIEPTIFQHWSDALITAQATGNSSDEQVICELTGWLHHTVTLWQKNVQNNRIAQPWCLNYFIKTCSHKNPRHPSSHLAALLPMAEMRLEEGRGELFLQWAVMLLFSFLVMFIVYIKFYVFASSAVVVVALHVNRLVTEPWIVGITNAHHSVTEVIHVTNYHILLL